MEDLTCKAEIDTQMQRTNIYRYQGMEGWVEGTGEIGIGIYTLLILCIKKMTNEALLYSTGYST